MEYKGWNSSLTPLIEDDFMDNNEYQSEFNYSQLSGCDDLIFPGEIFI